MVEFLIGLCIVIDNTRKLLIYLQQRAENRQQLLIMEKEIEKRRGDLIDLPVEITEMDCTLFPEIPVSEEFLSSSFLLKLIVGSFFFSILCYIEVEKISIQMIFNNLKNFWFSLFSVREESKDRIKEIPTESDIENAKNFIFKLFTNGLILFIPYSCSLLLLLILGYFVYKIHYQNNSSAYEEKEILKKNEIEEFIELNRLLREENSKFAKCIHDLQFEIDERQYQINELNAYLSERNTQLDKLVKLKEKKEGIQSIKNKMNAINVDIDSMKNQMNNVTVNIDSIKNQMNTITVNMDSIKTKINTLEKS